MLPRRVQSGTRLRIRGSSGGDAVPDCPLSFWSLRDSRKGWPAQAEVFTGKPVADWPSPMVSRLESTEYTELSDTIEKGSGVEQDELQLRIRQLRRGQNLSDCSRHDLHRYRSRRLRRGHAGAAHWLPPGLSRNDRCMVQVRVLNRHNRRSQ